MRRPFADGRDDIAVEQDRDADVRVTCEPTMGCTSISATPDAAGI